MWTPTQAETSFDKTFFRPLSDAEEEEFRAWAHANDPKQWGADKIMLLHPVIRDEWELRGRINRTIAYSVREALR